MKPNLFIVGAPKCGTTAWYEYLRAHPDIHFPEIKEPHYFSPDFPLYREATDLNSYMALFGESDAKIIGEASVFYMYSEEAASNIHDFNPDAKIIMFVRDQEYFIPSFHQQLLFTLDDEMEDFELAWDLSGKRPADSVPSTCRDVKLLDYKRLGHLKDQIDRFTKFFAPEQIAIIRFDDWVRDPRAMYVKILEFLGVEDDGRDDFPPVNQARFHKSRRVARFLQNPPWWVRIPKNQLKRMLNVKSLGIADKIAPFNREPGYTSKPSEELMRRIAEYYTAEGQRIQQWGLQHL